MIRLAMIALVVGLAFAPHARAQTSTQSAWCVEEPCLPPKPDATRTLNGHAFMPMQTVPWAFVATRVGSLTAMGAVRLKAIPVLTQNPDVTVNIAGTNAKLVSFTQSFLTDIRLARFIALSVGFGMGNAVGINSSGAFNLGINYAFGATGGLIFRLAQGDKWYLSFRADGVYQRAEAVLPAQIVETAQEQNGNITFNVSSLTRGGTISRGSGALMLAASPHRMFGLQSALGFQTTRTDVEESSGRVGILLASLSGSLRFDSLGVPVAALLGGALQVRTDETENVFFPTVGYQGRVAGYIEPAIFYSDPKYVDVGLTSVFQIASNDHRKQAIIVLNHFW